MSGAVRCGINRREIFVTPHAIEPNAVTLICTQVLSEKTHVFDVANRPWLLPFIAARAEGAARDLLLTFIRHASAENPDDRPSFADLVGRIDRFEAKARRTR
jgi:hypothetical protein